jgi:cell fate (sporulation/competence/biofilm development) regulator YlbF (YheA/YmcA/DUF963 family)
LYHDILELLNKGAAVNEARRQLREADREPDILQRFIKRGEALKRLEEAQKSFDNFIARGYKNE